MPTEERGSLAMADEKDRTDAGRAAEASFLKGATDGRCPVCGELAEARDSDEGPAFDHWFERYYECDCGATFTEQFDMVPKAVFAD